MFLLLDESFSLYKLQLTSACRWEIAVMEYQVLIYCIMDSEMMPPAVLPPVLSAERHVAAHIFTARLPAHSTSERKHIPINQPKSTRSSSNGTSCSHKKGGEEMVCPYSSVLWTLPFVTLMNCLSWPVLAPAWKMKPLTVEEEEWR